MALSKTTTSLKLAARDSTATIEDVGFEGYGAVSWGAHHLRLSAAYMTSRAAIQRKVSFSTYSDELKADYGLHALRLAVEASRPGVFSGTGIEPFGEIAYVHAGISAIAEQGSDSGLSGGDATHGLFLATVGVRAEHAIGENGARGMLRGGLAWRQVLSESIPTESLQLAGG